MPFKTPRELSDVFTNFRKTVEPLREAPRKQLPAPSSLPALPSHTPPQFEPFQVPDSLDAIISALEAPLSPNLQIPDTPSWPKGTQSCHPYKGGASTGHERIQHLVTSGSMTT